MIEQKTQNTQAHQTDQASGLREIFGEGVARVWCLVSSLPGDPTVLVALGVANALRRAGQRVLVVDQVPLTNRSLIGGTPFPVRYDLSQAFTGAIGLDRVVKQVGDKLWYCVATKLRRAREDKKARLPTLAQRLNRTGIDIDVVIVASTDPHRGTNQLFADDLEHILISGTDEASLQRSLAIVSELAVLFGGESIPVLTVGGGSAEVGIDSFNLLHEQSKALMDQPLEHQGWVRATQFATTAGEGTDTVLPSSLFRLMAGRIFPEGIGNSQRELNVIPNP